MTFFQAVAVDFDGTLTSRGQISPAAIDTIHQVQRNGMRVILVTGRIGAELTAEFPQITGHIDALVLENGAVIVVDGRTHLLSTPVDAVFVDALAARGVPYRRGQVLLATDGAHASTVVEVIGELGLDYHVIRNRGALMVLPAGVTKGTGLCAALAELNLSPHNTVAVGDAENDLSLFAAAEIGVAVADAIESVRHHADLVLDRPDGAGVAELLTSPYLSGTRRWCPPRRWIDIGTYDDGTPTQLPGSQGRVLVTGPAAAGKSYLVGLLAERWILAGYSVIVIDPEGDHVQLRQLNHTQVVDSRDHLPAPAELVKTLQPHTSIVVDMSALSTESKIDYLHRLRSTAEAHRERYGFPHWMLYDEAHLLGTDEQPSWMRHGSYVLSSFTPKSLPAGETEASDVVLTLTVADGPADLVSEWRATVRFGSGTARPFVIAERRTTHVRHRHKYADVCLPDARRFYFHTAERPAIPPAATMDDFRTAILHLDQQTLQYHLERGDFSRWLDNAIADKDFAKHMAAWEDELQAHRVADLERIRRELVHAVEDRYLPTQHSR